MYEYKAEIIAWKDGDTPVVHLDLGFSVFTEQTVRVLGINTPEVHSRDVVEKQRGQAALARAKELAPIGSTVVLKSFKPGGGDKFGRYLASLSLKDGRDYSGVMVDEKHALPWDGQGQKPI